MTLAGTAYSQTRSITKDNAITIAEREARARHYEPRDMIVEADEANSQWQAFLAKFPRHEPHAVHEEPLASLLAKLRGKTGSSAPRPSELRRPGEPSAA
jgi:hypothetical protein